MARWLIVKVFWSTSALPVIEDEQFQREVWDYKRVGWSALIDYISMLDWSLIDSLPVHGVVDYFTSSVLTAARKCIPTKMITEHKSTHIWLNNACRSAIDEKNAADPSSPVFFVRCQAMTEALKKAYEEYTTEIRSKLSTLPRSSKEWWKLNRTLLNNKHASSFIDSLPQRWRFMDS